jgi:serine/threonine protein kinase
MAPEQIQGHAVPASDQYALAVVVYEWLCGAPLFTGSYAEIAAQHTYATPQPLRQRVATISAEVEQVVLTALSKDPQRRFKSVYNQATGGTPALNDSLRAQSKNNWDEVQSSQASCSFAKGMYDSTTTSGYFRSCMAEATNFGNLAYQVEMNVVSGHSGGLVLRATANTSGYYFRLSTDGTELAEKLVINAQGNNTTSTSLFAGRSAAANMGNNQFNTITVIMRGSGMYMYINRQYAFHTSDSSYTSGLIGVFADSDASSSEILFRNAQVWKL